MALISEAQGACPLTVEDILPLLADFTVIDDLKVGPTPYFHTPNPIPHTPNPTPHKLHLKP